MENVIVSREELFKLVWSTPLTTLAKQYSLSDSGLRKVCIRMRIPLPKAGHWEKIRAGRKVVVETLPDDYTGVLNVTLSSLNVDEQKKRIAATIKRKFLKENEIDPAFRVPEKLINPDKLIVNTKESIEDERSSRWDEPPRKKYLECLNINVSKENLSRALRFMDAFIKVIRSHGHKFIVENGTHVIIGEEKISICLRDLSKRITVDDRNWKHTKLVPTGKMILITTFYWQKEFSWKDGSVPLELQLQNIVSKLELKVIEVKEFRLKIEKGWAEQREEERLRKEFEELRSKELSNFRNLFIIAKRWKEAEGLRNYLDDYEKRLKLKGILSEDKTGWLEWARKKVDWYDPEIESEDELLKGVNRDDLNKQKSGPLMFNKFEY